MKKVFKLTKRMIVNYLVDVQGHSEDEAEKVVALYGMKYLVGDELRDCIEFNN